jgi:hypothetical protein
LPPAIAAASPAAAVAAPLSIAAMLSLLSVSPLSHAMSSIFCANVKFCTLPPAPEGSSSFSVCTAAK